MLILLAVLVIVALVLSYATLRLTARIDDAEERTLGIRRS